MPRTCRLTSDPSHSRISTGFGCIPQKSKGRTGGALAAAALLCAVGAMGQSTAPYTFTNWQPLGTTSPAASVTITSQATGVVSSIQIVTMGTAGLEYADAGGACATFNFTATGQTCTESVTFTPKYPGTRLGAIVLLSANNTVLGNRVPVRGRQGRPRTDDSGRTHDRGRKRRFQSGGKRARSQRRFVPAHQPGRGWGRGHLYCGQSPQHDSQSGHHPDRLHHRRRWGFRVQRR